MWEKIKSWLFSSRGRKAPDGSDKLIPLDSEKVADELGPDHLGLADGRKEMPPASATSPGGSEQKIVYFFQQEALAAQDLIDTRLKDLKNAQQKKKLSVEESFLKSVIKKLESSANSVLAGTSPELQQLKDSENELRDEYHVFRQRNRLGRSANYPDSWLFLTAVIVAILMIEAMLNGYFFAQANTFGLVGGVGQALITAGVNIAISWMLGWLVLRQWNHVHKGRRAIGWLGLLLFLCWMVVYNLFIGHYRDAIPKDGAATIPVVTDVGQNLVNNPLGLSGDSWLLFAMGIFFAVIALLDGYNFDDPYPGYGSLARRLEEAQDDYQSALRGVRIALENLKEQSLIDLQKTNTEIEKRHRVINDWSTAAQIYYENFINYFSDLNAMCIQMVQRYRDSNISARQSDPPEYFSESLKLEDRVTVSLKPPADDEYLQAEHERLKDLANSVHSLEDKVTRTYNRFADELNSQVQRIEG